MAEAACADVTGAGHKAALFDSGQFYVNAFPVDCKPNAEPVVRFRSSSKAGGLRAAVFYLDVFDTSNGSDRPDRGTGLRKAFSGTIKCRQEQIYDSGYQQVRVIIFSLSYGDQGQQRRKRSPLFHRCT
jgi:hypothetical protein